VNALRAHTEHDVRLIDLRRWGQFDHDLVYSESPAEALELAEKADVIHLYNYLDYDSHDFSPIDFRSLRERGKLFVRQFNSAPSTVARRMGYDMSRVLDSSIPALVGAQCWERLYPKARLVPLIVPQDDPGYFPSDEPGTGILFSPGSPEPTWQRRWGAKGYKQTVALLARVTERTGCEAEVIDDDRPLADVLPAKRDRMVVVDDVVTGSFHASGLEGLCLARASLAFLDDRVQYVLREFTHSPVNPFVSVTLEDAEDVLTYLVRHPDEADELGRAGRAWIEKHWADHLLVRHFVDVYETLAEGRPIERQPEFSLDGMRFAAIVVPDLAWAARRRRALAARSFGEKLGERLRNTYHRLPWPVRRGARALLGRTQADSADVAAANLDQRMYDAEIRALGTSPND
jgi:hypothetical protein